MKMDAPVCEEITVHEEIINHVNKEMLTMEVYHDLGTLFKMFSDPTRLRILSLLFQSEMCVCDIVALLDMTQSAVSHQLSVLRANRLIKYRRVGKNIYYSLDDEHIQYIFNAGVEHIQEH